MASRGQKLLVWLGVGLGLSSVAWWLTPHAPSATALTSSPSASPQVGERAAPAVRPAALTIPALPPSSAPAEAGAGRPLRVRLERCAALPSGVKQLEAPPAGSVLGGDLALFVARIDPHTLEPIKVVMHNPDARFPLASTYKQSVLWALLRQMDAGEVRSSERFSVTRANRSLGQYPYDGSSVRQLAERMIRESDNTATDILHRRIGLEAPQRLADELGLCKTRLLLPTKAWWTAQAGLEPGHFSKYSRLKGASQYASAVRPLQLEMAELLDRRAQSLSAEQVQRNLDRYFDGPYYDPRIDQQTQNASTAFEWATLMTHQYLSSGLTPQSERALAEIMNLGVGKGFIGPSVPFVRFGGKTGNGWRILTVSGYVQTVQGQHLVYVLLNQNSPLTYTLRPGYLRAAYRWVLGGIRQIQDDDARALHLARRQVWQGSQAALEPAPSGESLAQTSR